MSRDPSGHGRLIGLALFVFVLAALLAVIFARIGVPTLVLATLAGALALACTVAAGLSGGTMRLATFLDGGRQAGGTVVALAAAMIAAPVFGLGAGAPAAIGLVGLALVAARSLADSGATGWPDYVRLRFGTPVLAVAVALVVGLASLVLAAAMAGRFVDLLSAALDLPRNAAGACAFALMALVLLPGGTNGLTRAAAVAGSVGLACGLLLAGVALRVGALQGADFAAVFSKPEWLGPAALAAALPSLPLVAGTVRDPGAARRGLLGAALLAIVLDLVTPVAGAGLAGAAAPAVVAACGTFIAACALALAAGLALGRDLFGAPRPLSARSARFARLRLATLLGLAVAAWLGAAEPRLVRFAWEPAATLLVGAVLPPVLAGAVTARSGRAAAFAGFAAGAAAAVLLGSGLVPPPGGGDLAGLWSAAAGLAAASAVAWLRPAGGRPAGGTPAIDAAAP